MKRHWDYYINKNKYSDCQLITALNAYYYLTGKFIKQDSKRYESLVYLSKCRYGSAIGIEKVWKRLGIKVLHQGSDLWEIRKHIPEKKDNKAVFPLPLSVVVWHQRYGFHSVLIIDIDHVCDAYRITNFDRETTSQGWIFCEDFTKWIASAPCFKDKIYQWFGLA